MVKDNGMRILLIEPSPLARNIYCLILRRIADCKIIETEDLYGINVLPLPQEPFDLLLIGERAFHGSGEKLRTLLTDVTQWKRLPKLIIALPTATGRKQPWDGLFCTTILMRPFQSADLVKIVKACRKEQS